MKPAICTARGSLGAGGSRAGSGRRRAIDGAYDLYAIAIEASQRRSSGRRRETPDSHSDNNPRVSDLQIVIAALFVAAAGLNALANWLNVPYPIPLVIGGLVLGLLPGIPTVRVNPELVLLVFLPP